VSLPEFICPAHYSGVAEGRIWIQKGEVIDALTNELNGESAFKRFFHGKQAILKFCPMSPPELEAFSLLTRVCC
jgi:hypothetical protein